MTATKAKPGGMLEMPETPVFSISLVGPFKVVTSANEEVHVRTRKSKALIAALCVAPSGRRGRAWLQALLWSDRADKQASSSLRQAIYEVRKALEAHGDVLNCTAEYIEIDLRRVRVDVLAMNDSEWEWASVARSEFLEGLDVKDPEFDDWLREQRQVWTHRSAKQPPSTIPAAAKDVIKERNSASPPQEWDLALAVLPLQNQTGVPALQFVGEGISEDLIDCLQRIKWLPVIARASSFTDHDAKNPSDRHAFARSLGAALYIHGALFLSEGKLQLRLRLQETESDRIIWTEQMELPELVSGDGIIEVLNGIVAAIDRVVSLNFQERAISSQQDDTEFMHHIWRGRWHLARLTSEDSAKAHDFFDAALALRPESSEALIQMSYWHLWKAWAKRGNEDLLQEGARLARLAALTAPDDGRCYALIGMSESWSRQHASAIQQLSRAIELTPSLAIAHHQLGSAYCLDNQPDKAVGPLRKAIRYSPRDQLDFTYQTELAVALLMQNQPLDAWVHATNALAQKPRYWYAHLVRMKAAESIGDKSMADQAEIALGASGVHITDQHYNWLPFKSDEWKEELFNFAPNTK